MKFRTITKIEKRNKKSGAEIKRRDFQPKTRAFFTDLSLYRKKEGRNDFLSRYTSLRFKLTQIEKIFESLNVGKKNNIRILSKPKVSLIAKKVVILFQQASVIRFLSFKKNPDFQKKNIKILDGLVFIPLFNLIKSFLGYLENNGNIFNFKISIFLFNNLKHEILRLKRYPAEIRHQNLTNFYFTTLSLMWSKEKFKNFEAQILIKSKPI